MHVRNRLADVVKLRSNVCQDFLKMIIVPEWQNVLYEKAQLEMNGKFRDKYIVAYEKMRDMGIKNYQIDNMDVTIISQIIRWGGIIVKIDKYTKKAMDLVTEDRNIKDHYSENEGAEELYLYGLLALCNLKNFVRAVDKHETTIDDATRLEFRNKYIPEIEKLKDVLDTERIALVQRQKQISMEIDQIISSKTPLKTWVQINELYIKQYLELNKAPDVVEEFMVQASDAGIPYAHLQAGDVFLRMKNYEEFERRISLFRSVMEPNDVAGAQSIIESLTIYMMRGNVLTHGMIQIIEGLVNEGYPIVKYENGFYGYSKKRKTHHTETT